MAAETLVERLLGLAASGDVPAAVQLRAIMDALDRSNVVGTQEVAVTLQPWEQKMRGAVKVRYRRASRDSEQSGDGAESTEDIVDAEVVEDPEYEAMLDEEMRQSESKRRDRKRRGQPLALPSEQGAPPVEAERPQPRPRVHKPEVDMSYVADPPTRKTDEQWHAEQLAKARGAGKGRLRPNPRVKRR
jgi:hypothetical protein